MREVCAGSRGEEWASSLEKNVKAWEGGNRDREQCGAFLTEGTAWAHIQGQGIAWPLQGTSFLFLLEYEAVRYKVWRDGLGEKVRYHIRRGGRSCVPCWNICGLLLVSRTIYFGLKLSGLCLWGKKTNTKKTQTTHVFEGALKLSITEHMFVSSQVMEKGKVLPTLGQCRSAQSQQNKDIDQSLCLLLWYRSSLINGVSAMRKVTKYCSNHP